jgi:hypothetical protein
MFRPVPFLVGLAVLLGGGVVHGLWTNRWRASEELAKAAERLQALPDDVGDWKGEVLEPDADELRLTGAAGHWSRTFTDPDTGEQVLVILLCGRPAAMSMHRPEHCYGSAGYETSGPAVRARITAPGAPVSEWWTAVFARDEGKAPGQVRIFWSWSTPGGAWEAPDSPRLAFAGRQAVYKMYVIRNVTESAGPADDPCVKLLGLLAPILDGALSPS